MVTSGVHSRPDLSHRGGRPGLDLTVSKLRRPPVRPGTVCRSLLIDQLAGEDSRSIVSVVAPAGYGKTTLLAQWAERDGRSFAWVSVDDKDNDPKVLLRYVAEALDAIEPVGQRVFDALASPGSSVPGSEERSGPRRPRSAAMTGWCASTWSRSSWTGFPGGTGSS